MDLIESTNTNIEKNKKKRARSHSPVKINNDLTNKYKIIRRESGTINKPTFRPKLTIEIEQRNLELDLDSSIAQKPNNLTNVPSTPRNSNSKIKLSRQNSMPK